VEPLKRPIEKPIQTRETADMAGFILRGTFSLLPEDIGSNIERATAWTNKLVRRYGSAQVAQVVTLSRESGKTLQNDYEIYVKKST
jgi:hypothetical protein